MRLTGLVVVAIAVLLGAGQPKKTEAKNPSDELQGGWSMVLLFVSGEETPAEQAKSGELVVEDDVYRSKLGATVETSTFKIDATKSPKAIDFTYTSGFLKGKTVKGIYKIDGDDLTICRGLSPETDPAGRIRSARWIPVCCSWCGSGRRPSARRRRRPSRTRSSDSRRRWKFVSIDVEGNTVPAELFQEDRLILKGKQFTSTVRGTTTHGTFKIDPDGQPQDDRHHFHRRPGQGQYAEGHLRARRRHPEDLLVRAGKTQADRVRSQAQERPDAPGPRESEALKWICSLI